MLQFLALLLFGWPIIIASLVFGIAGMIWKKPLWILIGGVLVLPHAYYLSGSPLIGWAGVLLPLAYIGSAIATWYKVAWLTGLLLLPQIALDVWLAYSVFAQ